MQFSTVITEIDLEIARLKQAKTLLASMAGSGIRHTTKTKSAAKSVDRSLLPKRKRRLTAEGRQRISEAVRRRWELQKRAASK